MVPAMTADAVLNLAIAPYNWLIGIYDPPPLNGKNAVVTGGTSGIGFWVARGLLAHGARVIVTGRRPDKGQRAVDEFKKDIPGAQVEFMKCDLSDFGQVRGFATQLNSSGMPLHILVNNAGLAEPPVLRNKLGFEMTLAANFWGGFLLTHLLLPKLRASTPSRIVFHSSGLERFGHIDWNDLQGRHAKHADLKQYATSKLMELMAAEEMSRRLHGSGVAVHASHPGLAKSSIAETAKKHGQLIGIAFYVFQLLYGQSPARAANATIYAATAPELQDAPFKYIGPWNGYAILLNCNLRNTGERHPANPMARDECCCYRLYEEGIRILKKLDPSLHEGKELLTEE